MNIAQTGGTSTLTEHGAGNSCYATGGQAIHRVPVEVWQSVLECDQQTPPHLVRLATGRGAAGHGLRHLAKAAKADSLMRRYTPPQFDEALAGDHRLASFVNRVKQVKRATRDAILALWRIADERIRLTTYPSEVRRRFINKFTIDTRGLEALHHPDLFIARVAVNGVAEFDPRLAAITDATVGQSIREVDDSAIRQHLFMAAVEASFFYKKNLTSFLSPSLPPRENRVLHWQVEEHNLTLKQSIASALATDIETAISLIRYAPALTRYLPGTKWEFDDRVWWAAISQHDQSDIPCYHLPRSIGAQANYVQKAISIHGDKAYRLAAMMPDVSSDFLLTLVPEHPGVLQFFYDTAIGQDPQFNAAAIAANVNAYYFLDSDYVKDEATVAAMHAAGLTFTPAIFAHYEHLYTNDNLLLSLARKRYEHLPEIIWSSELYATNNEAMVDLFATNSWFRSVALDIDDYGSNILKFISNYPSKCDELLDRKMRLFLGAFHKWEYLSWFETYHDEQQWRVMTYASNDVVNFLDLVFKNHYNKDDELDSLLLSESEALFSDLSYVLYYLRFSGFKFTPLLKPDTDQIELNIDYNPLLAGLRDLLDDEDTVMKLATMDPRIVRVISQRLMTNDAFFQQLLQVCAKAPIPQPVEWEFLAREKPEDLAWVQAKLRDHRFDAPEYEI